MIGARGLLRRPSAAIPHVPARGLRGGQQPFCLSGCQSCFDANDLHFGLEIDATLAGGGGLDLFDKGEKLLSGGSSVVDDEVTMHLGNARPSHGEVLETKLFD